ncbi:PLAC8 family-domain-containing protein [Aspergillus pseudoustus]|uniref:PLAC8 family-domain-containing protein n=1 Tax=Aspergillus pseudoustus TaxID=1810923 RepID=A0ABR4KUI3_9EURO
MSNEWNHSLWDCFSPVKECFLGWCCPCALYGRTAERLEDPALKEGSYVNGDCCLFYLASCCGLYWVLMMMKRRDLREKFGIKGSVGEDCILSCCCSCCVLVQQEKELDAQANRLQTGGYQAPPNMAYPGNGAQPDGVYPNGAYPPNQGYPPK